MQALEDPKLDTLDCIRIFQHVNRVWRPYLSMKERDFLFYLLDNTICWQRSTVRVTIDQMVRGTAWLPSVGLSERSVYRLLAGMRERGLLATATNGRVTRITLNLNWTPEVLKLPKRLKTGGANKSARPKSCFMEEFSAPVDSTDVQSTENRELPNWQSRTAKLADQNCQIGSPIKNQALSNRLESRPPATGSNPGGEPADPTRPLSAVAAVAAGRSKARSRRALDVERSSETVWRDAHVLATPKVRVIPWTRAEAGMMRKLESRAKGTGLQWEHFLTWVVAHWAEIRTAKFGWMTRQPPPETPQPRFIVGFADKFFDAYAEREADDRLTTATGEEADVERLMRSGLSRDAALIEVGKRRGVAERRAEIDAAQAEAARLLRVAEKAHALPVPAVLRRPLPAGKVVHGANPFDDPDAPLPEGDPTLRWHDDE